MTERPADVRIDDLAAPRFSPDVAQLLAGLAQVGAGLELTFLEAAMPDFKRMHER